MSYNTLRTPNKITPEHLDRLAYIYIRQSTLFQVRQNTASTERQYDLTKRAYELGWSKEHIVIIDEDQGHSGASSADRTGFQRLVLEVSLGRVGAVIGLEVSRLARSSSDWYRLLELCALTNCLVIDEEGVYDPNHFNDRLILGMKGNLSEYELHFLKTRLWGGKLRKAEQGQLRTGLPVGYLYDASGHAVFDPDEQVQQAICLAFSLFDQLGSALAVVKYFKEHQLLFPTRLYGGLHNGELTWTPLRHGRLLQVLHNPTYAGAYVFGRTTTRKPTPISPTKPQVSTRQVPLEDWPILIQNIYPAYITWEQFLRNRKRLDDNRTNRDIPRPGAVREGAALLQGIILCGLCGRRMSVRYTGSSGLAYVCSARHKDYAEKTCQTLKGQPVDHAVSEAFLQAITPAQLAISLKTLDHLEQQAAQVERQGQLRLERARYEAERARRQFDQAEPENRLVVRTLERAWEEKLQQLQRLERDYETRPRPQLLTLTPEARQKIFNLAQDLPALWRADTTSNQERKQLLRLLIQDVTLKKNTHTLHIAIRWQTEAITSLEIERPRKAYEIKKTQQPLVDQIRELTQTHTDRQIVDILNQQGVQSPTGKTFTLSMVKWIRWAYNIPTTCPAGPTEKNLERRGDGRYSTKATAKQLNVDISTVMWWCKQGKLDGIQDIPHGPWWIRLTDDVVKELGRPFPRKRPKRPWIVRSNG